MLGLIGDQQSPCDAGEFCGVAAQGAVRGEDEAVGFQVVQGTAGTVEASYRRTGREPVDLTLPVAEQGGRTDDEGRPRGVG